VNITYLMRLGLCYLIATVPVMAQENIRLRAEVFEDTERPASLISVPHWLRGLRLAAQTSQNRPRLAIFIPSNWADQKICAEATTIDGRFLVKGQYTLPGSWVEGLTELDYPTRFPTPWSLTDPLATSVLIRQGGCDITGNRADQLVIPAVLNGGDDLKRDIEGRAQLFFQLHARNTQEVVASLTFGAVNFDADCQKIKKLDAIQFNFACQIALPGEAYGPAIFKYIRLNAGRQSRPRTAHIIVPLLK